MVVAALRKYLHLTLFFFKFIHYFASLTAFKMAQSYTVRGELVSVGTKKVTVRCPVKFKKNLDSGSHLLPINEFSRRSKDVDDVSNTMTFFRLKTFDSNFASKDGEPPKVYEVQFEVPEEVSSSIVIDEFGGSHHARLVASNEAATQYLDDLDAAVKCWFEGVRAKCDDTRGEIEYRPLSKSGVSLKWTSKTRSVEEFINGFDPIRQKYVLTLSCGYHSGKDQKIGVALGLSMFTNFTKFGAYEHREGMGKAKRRRVVQLDPVSGAEIEYTAEIVEEGESESKEEASAEVV